MQSAQAMMDSPDLAGHLETWIEQRTGGRIRDVRVEIVGRRVIVHGHAGSYYVRQLALAAVLDALRMEWIDQVDLDVHVGNTGWPGIGNRLQGTGDSRR
jgi:hypothetical protein